MTRYEILLGLPPPPQTTPRAILFAGPRRSGRTTALLNQLRAFVETNPGSTILLLTHSFQYSKEILPQGWQDRGNIILGSALSKKILGLNIKALYIDDANFSEADLEEIILRCKNIEEICMTSFINNPHGPSSHTKFAGLDWSLGHRGNMHDQFL